jgi:hypothetical protein
MSVSLRIKELSSCPLQGRGKKLYFPSAPKKGGIFDHESQ